MRTELVRDLASEYPGSTHVRDVGLRGAEDSQIWHHAHTHGFAIVSKDTDFRERSYVEGFPPKVIWLDVGNAGTAAIAALMNNEIPDQVQVIVATGTFTPSRLTMAGSHFGLRLWFDANRNGVPDCDFQNPAANGECGAPANPNPKNLMLTATRS